MINLVADFLLPPASLAVLAVVFLLVGGAWGRLGSTTCLIVLVALGLPFVSTSLLNSLAPTAGDAAHGPPLSAIVILSADGVRTDNPTDLDPGPLTLERTRTGATLARQSGLPVLVSGGRMSDSRTTLAAMMADSLRDDFNLPVRWQEDRSRDTWENAEFSAQILRREGVNRIYLVTHGWHMRRALLAFRHFGLDPVAVPVQQHPAALSWRSFSLSPVAWFNSYVAFHEWVGFLYYMVRR